jgi:hypothetical protein
MLGTLETHGRGGMAALTAPASGRSGGLSVARRTTTLAVADAARYAGGAGGRVGDADEASRCARVRAVHGVDLAQARCADRGPEPRRRDPAGCTLSRAGADPRAAAARLDNLDGQLRCVLAATGRCGGIEPSNALSGKLQVDLAARKTGLLTVPLDVSGTLDAPSVTLSRGAALGAAIGTAILPGVGTSAGARLGDKLAATSSRTCLDARIFGVTPACQTGWR